ncbi:MAG: O-antigen ligase family protein [Thermodesulfobacteriota bacterium]
MAQSNPLMKAAEKLVDDFVYLAPSYYKFMGTYYRPYAVYFHPSEAGTFVAMGLPFVYYTVRDKHPLFKYAALALAGAGVVLNFTRGVWVALGITLLVRNFSRIKRYLPAAAAAVILALGVFALSMSGSGFGKRVFDPSNLSNRLYYWKVGYNMFINYFPFGIGHMNFKTRYLEFVDTEPAPPGLEVKEVFVADNVFLTTLVEHGVLGFAAQMAFYIASIWMVAKVSRMYRKHGDTKNALRLNVFLQAALIYLLAGTFADVQLFAKVTKMFFVILGMAMAVCRFAPGGGAAPSVQSEPADSAPPHVGGPMRPLPNPF